jgi:hypothetical protein
MGGAGDDPVEREADDGDGANVVTGGHLAIEADETNPASPV